MRHAAAEATECELACQLAELLEAAGSTRVKAGHVRVDKWKVGHLVKQLNSATGTQTHRDWRDRVTTVGVASPLAAAANETSEAVARARSLALTDDVLLRYGVAEQLAAALRRAVT
jgi:hypothetical protein